VDALQSHTVRASGRRRGPQVDGRLLALLAATARDREILRFAYADHAGRPSERRVEPYRLVNQGRRWYLVAFDVERADWRTFRVDRIADARSVGHRFALRELPAEDIAAYVASKTRQVQIKVHASALVHASAQEVADRFGWWLDDGSIEALGADRCVVRLGGRSVDDIAFWLGTLDRDFEVVDSPDLRAAVQRYADRYARAVGAG
jgi:predicted DNA-binding transcriptional regulator YafY